ncbi:tetratricopeptide repeat protein [Aequorivita sp. KMM 9714]|uniref:tetratricopeptide repeat protein n=1 Tax=Aequorivita sp. KMM 9714 TaxID=2707173 RepID=UPI0013EDF117|nr:tetratricopeptide repeat protein [Aequorivita sp. KMM 9714]NGX82874.1 tetratricopeptide repeat protein [Aequorivita sp. KMM 9714]
MTISDMESEAHELFVAYLENELSSSEREIFERKLNEDSKFEAEFLEFKNIYVILENKLSPERASVLETIKQANSNFNYKPLKVTTEKTEKKVIKFKPWKYGIAASILLAIGIFIFNNFSKPTYSDFATQETISLTVRSDVDETSKNAELSFNSADYAKALIHFNELLEVEPNNLQLQYYKAVALVELSEYDEADSLLKKISESNSVYASKAKWINALSYLKQKRYKETKKVANSITSSDPEYQKAQKLLSKL